jgi:valyl-tRNA synthetase
LSGREDTTPPEVAHSAFEKWLLMRRDQVTEGLEAHLDAYAFNHAAQLLYDFVWHELCDWAIEWVKWDERCRTIRPSLLKLVLKDALKLLHPFMPFVTEELWGSLGEEGFLMLSPFPVSRATEGPLEEVKAVQKCIEAFRQYRGEHEISFKVVLQASENGGTPMWWKTHASLIQRMVNLEILPKPKRPSSTQINVEGASFVLEALEAVSGAKEKERLEKEFKKLEAAYQHVEKQLSNPQFLDKAPAALVAAQRSKQEELGLKLKVARDALKAIVL